ncbi:MAG: potassium transporter TrkG [Desulfobacterales bacterium]
MGISKSIVRSPARTAIVAFALLIFIGTIMLMLPAASKGERVGCVDALFTSTSAVCVTGLTVVDTGSTFSLFGQFVILILIQVGGLGIMTMSTLFILLAGRRPGLAGQIVVQDAFTHSRERNILYRALSRLSLHSKIVLSTTFILIVSGMILILFMEWRNTLAPLPTSSRFLAAFFQSVTARTAGFNTLSIGGMANETLFLIILLMFIGASPGSCGGGIKTTSLATLVMLGLSRFKGRNRPLLFNRTISAGSVGKAVSVVILSALVVCIGIMLVLMTEIGEVPHTQSRGQFLELFFEVVSAFGTVGLSTGITGWLSEMGKIILSMVMFVGRLGPLVVGVALSRDTVTRYYFAEESIMVG